MSVLVDSGVLIDVSRGRDVDLVSRWIELSRSDVEERPGEEGDGALRRQGSGAEPGGGTGEDHKP